MGYMTIPGCPYDFVTPDVRALMRAATAAERGTWPVAGGLLDQADGAAEAIEAVWSERTRMQAKK